MRRSTALAALLAAAACARAPERPPLRVAMAPELESADPHRQIHGGLAALCNVYDGLVAFDAQWKVAPALARSWESPDDLTWRFHLRTGVRFQDGRPLSALDVVKSLERARRPGLVAAGYLAIVDRVGSPAPDVVEVHTTRPFPTLLNSLVPVFIAPADAPDTVAAAVGTGPYKLASFDPQQGLRLEAWDGSWRGRPAEPRVQFIFERDPDARVALLRAGRADVALRLSEGAPESAADYRLFSVAAPGVRVLGLRVDRPPFRDARLRRAVDLAVDRAEVTRELLGNRAAPMGQLLPQGVFGHVPDWAPVPRDAAAARRLVQAATGGRGLDASLVHGPSRAREAERIARHLGEAGIRLRLEQREIGDVEGAFARGEFAMYLWSLFSDTAEASDLFDNVLHSPAAARGYGAKNVTGYRNPALDLLVEQAARVQDHEAKRAAAAAILRRAMEDRPYVPLWEIPWVSGARADVEWTPRADGWFVAANARRR